MYLLVNSEICPWHFDMSFSHVGMTIEPAYASFTEDKLGSLVPGKLADFVVLSQDIMEVPAENILETTVLATALDGKVVYGEI